MASLARCRRPRRTTCTLCRRGSPRDDLRSAHVVLRSIWDGGVKSFMLLRVVQGSQRAQARSLALGSRLWYMQVTRNMLTGLLRHTSSFLVTMSTARSLHCLSGLAAAVSPQLACAAAQ